MRMENREMNTLYVLVGNIGSGKSTFTRKFIDEHPHNKIVCVSRDFLRYMVGGGKYIFYPPFEPVIFDCNELIIERFMQENFTDIVVDEVNICLNYRDDYIRLAKKYGYKTVALVLPKLDKETSVARRMKNDHGNQGKEIWETVWDKFNRMYEEPTEEEFDEVRHIKD